MHSILFKTAFVFSLVSVLSSNKLLAQNTSLPVLLNESQWNDLFPKRAGTYGIHPQGYTEDFFAYDSLVQAADELADYLVEIHIKEGVWGQLITITRKVSNDTYIYSDVESWWYTNPTPETVITVDFEDFVNRDNEVNNRRELGAFLANISKETTGGWQTPIGSESEGDYAQWGLYFVHELGYTSDNSAGVYSQASEEFPPNPAVGYYGRGPIQLSWNYNYGQFSKFIFNDKNILLDNPDLIQEGSVLAFKSAIWFWMMPQCPKPSCHQVMHDLWQPESNEYNSNKMYKKGFAHTNNIINGGLECRTFSTPVFTEKVILRSELYKYYLGILGLSETEIELEYTAEYTTLCYESDVDAMEDYINCFVNETLSTGDKKLIDLSVYPNPAFDVVQCYSPITIDRVCITNTMGHVVSTLNVQAQNKVLEISHLSKGIYYLHFFIDDRIVTKKIVLVN
jgi:basic endochitinase B